MQSPAILQGLHYCKSWLILEQLLCQSLGLCYAVISAISLRKNVSLFSLRIVMANASISENSKADFVKPNENVLF